MSEKTHRVLVVDDDRNVLASVERGLRLSGFSVLTAGDGSAALRAVGSHSPDAIVLDMNMPVLDGDTVVKALRAMGNEVPICVLSRVAASPTGYPGWKRAQMTTWSSRSRRPSWWPD